MNCPECDTTLLIDLIPAAASIRCPSCSNVAPRTSASSAEANRFAWRSFWLGLSSIVLLFFTGIPAIWYGIRSLLEMRFIRSQKHDRKAAIAGTTLGVLFGILGSGILAIIGGFALIISLAVENTEDPQRIREISNSIAAINLPNEFEPVTAREVTDQFHRATWRDGDSAETANGRVRFLKVRRDGQIGRQQLGSPVINFRLHREILDVETSKESTTLTWKFSGKDHGILKLTRSVDGEDFNTVRYTAVTDESFDPKDVWALVASFRSPGKYSEDDIRKIFESFEPQR